MTDFPQDASEPKAAAPGLRIEKSGKSGVIVLDRPKARNALTLDMIDAMARALDDYEDDGEITSVLIKSAVEGTFCSGGDVRAVHTARRDARHGEADAFFHREFNLNARIADLPKPYVALINGNCFGGGMGISVHGSHRIVGEKAVLAMPETAIGYVPDVGASHFLTKLPTAVGLFIGLTGYQLSVGDAIYTGLATAFVPAQKHKIFEAGLRDGAPAKVLTEELSEEPSESGLAENFDLVTRCFSAASVEEIERRLERESGSFANEARSRLDYAAPSSLKATLDLLEGNKGRSLRECLDVELDYAKRITRGPDFAEGIRALLIDKDRKPRWAGRPE